MRSCVAIFIYSFSFIRWIDAQTDLWYEQMNIDPQTSSGWSGTVPNYNTVADAECPGTTNDFCWSFISTAASYQRSADTSQYVSVQLTYSINTFDLNGVEECFIDYSVENIATPTAFTDIERINTGSGYTQATAKTFNSWTGAAGIPKLTIRIGSDRAGVTCYFNEFRLSGVPITPQPSLPTAIPSLQPTAFPTKNPSRAPSRVPSGSPTVIPSASPSRQPSATPSASPTRATTTPTDAPTAPSTSPTRVPTRSTIVPSSAPTAAPSGSPSQPPSAVPTTAPSSAPSGSPSQPPSAAPTATPSAAPSTAPSVPTATPITAAPTAPSSIPSSNPTQTPTAITFGPTSNPTSGSLAPSRTPTAPPSTAPTAPPTTAPSGAPTSPPSTAPTAPSLNPSAAPSSAPSAPPSTAPSASPSANPSAAPSTAPSTAPTVAPSASTANPTLSPTTGRPTSPPTMQKCSRTDATRCYQTSVASYYTYTTYTRSLWIYNTHGYETDVYDIYFTTSYGYNCYHPYINVRYEPFDDMNPVLILDKQEAVLGSCTGAKRCAVSYRDCITNYDLGIDVLVSTKSYNLILFGRALANECNGTATINAYVDFVCGRIPTTTRAPTGAPTVPSVPPTTGAPTQPTQDPTPYPTADYSDGGGSIGLFILSHEFNSLGSYSLIFMVQSVQNVDLQLDTLVEWPLGRGAVQSIREMKDDAFCVEDTNCTSFWNVMYTADCPLMLSGSAWKVQFETNCVYQDYILKKRCLDYLQDKGVTDKRIILSTQNAFEIEDDLCDSALYSTEATLVEVRFYKHGKKDLIRSEGNLKYKEGDTVYLELEIVLSDPAFAVNGISYQNVFGCHQNETAFGVPLLTETKTGIGACVTSEKNYVLESSMTEGTQRLSFKIPRGVKSESEVFTIQIQAVLSIVQSNVRRRGLLQEDTVVPSGDQVRYFMTSVVLNGRASAMGGGELSGGGIAAIIIAAVAVCVVIFLVIYCRKNKEENEEKRTQTGELIAPKKLEAVKSVESVGSPQDTDGDIETGGIDLAEDEKPSKPKKKAPTRKELAKKKKKKPAAGAVATPMMLEMEEKKKKPESKPVAKKKVAAKKKGAVGAGAGVAPRQKEMDEKKKKKKEAAAAGKAGAKGNAGAKKKAVAKGKGGKKVAPKKKSPDSGKKKKGTGGKKKKGFVE